MKKSILILAAGLACSAFIATTLHAQSASNVLLLGPSPEFRAYTPVNTAAVKAKALREFHKSFPGVQDEQWNQAGNGWLLADFNTPEVRSIAIYDPHGNWEYTFRYYGEDQMPKDIRAQVKSSFYDYSIAGVQEIQLQDKVVYIVSIQDAKTWKKVRVADGDMDVIEDLNKY